MTNEEAIKVLEQEPCEDWYDVPSNEMTLEQARQAVKDLRKKLAEYLEQQPCEDCISRQAVHDLIAELLSDYLHDEDREKIEELDVKIEDLEPVTPKEKTGWIPVSERLPEVHTCNDGFIEPSDYVLVQMKSGCMKVSRYWGSIKRYKECPWIDLNYPTTDEVIAWMPLPERYKDGE